MRRFLGITILSLLICAPAAALPISELYQLEEFELDAIAKNERYRQITDALRVNEFETAVTLATRYVRENGRDSQGHLLLVLAWLGSGDQASIIQHLQELERQAPEVAAAINFELAKYYTRIGRFYRALNRLESISSPDSGAIEAIQLKAEVLERQIRFEDARHVYEGLLARQQNSPAAALLALARLHLLKAEAELSIGYANRFLRVDPQNPAGFAILGVSQMISGDIEAAEKSFTRLLSFDANSPSARFNLGLIHQISGKTDEATRQYVQARTSEARIGFAIAMFEPGSSVNLNPQDDTRPLAELVNAAAAVANSKVTEANAHYRSASDLFIDFSHPNFTIEAFPQGNTGAGALLTAWINLLYRQGYFRLVLDEFERDSSETKNAFAVVTAARAAWKLGNHEKAIGLYEQVALRYPQLVAPELEKADIAYHRDNIDEAIEGYEQVVAENSHLQSTALGLASLYNTANRSEDAIAQYQKITDSRYMAHAEDQIASTLLERMNDPKGALEHVMRARQLDSGSLAIQYTLAAVYYQLEKFEESARIYDRVAQKYGGGAEFYYRAGNAFLQVDDYARAAVFFEQALNFGQPFDGDEAAEKTLQSIWID